jgi:hypothetical protein
MTGNAVVQCGLYFVALVGLGFPLGGVLLLNRALDHARPVR